MTISKDRIVAVIARLAAAFPQTFTAEKHLPHRPLKIGIAADIRAALADLSRRALGTALAAYTKRLMYLQALTVGAPRVDLAGNPAGEVTAAEAEHAAVVLAGIMAARKAQRTKPVPVIAAAAAPPVAPPAAGVPVVVKRRRPVLDLRLGQRT
jgi:sRNA-binding protein